MIDTRMMAEQTGENAIEIDLLSKYVSGTYIARVQSGDEYKLLKFYVISY